MRIIDIYIHIYSTYHLFLYGLLRTCNDYLKLETEKFLLYFLFLSANKDGLRGRLVLDLKRITAKAHTALKGHTNPIDSDRRSEQSVISEYEQTWMEGLKQDWICF